MSDPDFDKMVFVIMPFGEEGTAEREQNDDTFEHLIAKGVEQADLGLTCVRADDVFESGSINRSMFEYTEQAKYVIADLSDNNPNVFYELGIRHSLNGRTVLLCKKGQELPFDLKDQRTIFYSKSLHRECHKSIQTIAGYLVNMEKAEHDFPSPVQVALSGVKPMAVIDDGIVPSDQLYLLRKLLRLRAELAGFDVRTVRQELPNVEIMTRVAYENHVEVIATYYADAGCDESVDDFLSDIVSLATESVQQNWAGLTCHFVCGAVVPDKAAITGRAIEAVAHNYSRMIPPGPATAIIGGEVRRFVWFNPVEEAVYEVFDELDLQRLRAELGILEGQ